MEPAAEATRGHMSAASLAMGPAVRPIVVSNSCTNMKSETNNTQNIATNKQMHDDHDFNNNIQLLQK
jgi:hypothetical protein